MAVRVPACNGRNGCNGFSRSSSRQEGSGCPGPQLQLQSPEAPNDTASCPRAKPANPNPSPSTLHAPPAPGVRRSLACDILLNPALVCSRRNPGRARCSRRLRLLHSIFLSGESTMSSRSSDADGCRSFRCRSACTGGSGLEGRGAAADALTQVPWELCATAYMTRAPALAG
jgi:hypothetical protein